MENKYVCTGRFAPRRDSAKRADCEIFETDPVKCRRRHASQTLRRNVGRQIAKWDDVNGEMQITAVVFVSIFKMVLRASYLF